jgi:hypothetical protein
MCCEQLRKEIRNEHFEKNDGLFIIYKSSDYDEDYGYSVFKNKVKIQFCPFCGSKY